jgi:acyl-CoA thioesterase
MTAGTPRLRSLEDVTTPRDGAISVDDTWLQGRGAYGGLTIGALVRAIEQHVADPRRRVRSVTAELPAPTVPGSASVDVEVLRSGNQLSHARASLRQGSTVTAHAVAVLAAAREGADAIAWREMSPPALPPFESLAPAPLTGAPGTPVFAQHFDYRIATGIPFANQGAPETTGWVRANQPGTLRDAAYVAAMIDVWYPAFLIRNTHPRPLATIAYTLELVSDIADLAADAPLAYRGTVPVCGDGYFFETRELWTADGRLVARNHQTFAIIR